MSGAKLWLSFHHQDEEIDHWAIFLDPIHAKECDIWQADGQTFEFEATHIRGMRPESALNFKEKWLIKDGLTQDDVKVIRGIANSHPVDNDGAYWDCRVYCFEILGALETAGVLIREDDSYRAVRKRLHEKWRTDDGVSKHASEEETDSVEDEEADLTRVADSDLEGESSPDDHDREDAETQNSYEKNAMAGRKRTLSHGTGEVSRSGIPVRALVKRKVSTSEKRRRGE